MVPKNSPNGPKVSVVDLDFEMQIQILIQIQPILADPDPIQIQVISVDQAQNFSDLLFWSLKICPVVQKL